MNHSTQSGGCQCGQVRYQLHAGQHQLNVCHCRDCQLQSGSAFGMSLVVPKSIFQVTEGKLSHFLTESASGREKTCAFCGHCGVRIYNTTSRYRSIKPGTLDDCSWLAPQAHYWISQKQSWIRLPSDVACFETSE